MAEQYAGPLSWLLRLGDRRLRTTLFPLKYSWFGIQARHIPDLIRMALDEDLVQDEEKPEAYAGIHAWRALGELRAAEAVDPLSGLLKYADEPYNSDWVLEDLPRALGQIGPAAIPILCAYGQNPAHGLWARTAALRALVHVAENYPEQQQEIVIRVQEGLAQADGEEMLAPWEDALIDLGVEIDRPDRGVQALLPPLHWTTAETTAPDGFSHARPKGKKKRTRRKSRRPHG